MNTQVQIVIPEISDEELAKRLNRIRFLQPAICGIDGKPYSTDQEDRRYLDDFYTVSNADPRTQAFNFDDNIKMTSRATGLTELLTKDIFVVITGHHSFCQISMEEALSQIPEEILDDVVAFALNPEAEAKILSDYFQSRSIIFYGKADEQLVNAALPSAEDLLRPINYAKTHRLKNQVMPMINFHAEGFVAIEPGNIDEPFMRVGICEKFNANKLYQTNIIRHIAQDYTLGETVSVYQPFTSGADFYHPTYAHVISQIPDKKINKKTIGLLYCSTDYFKTSEGVIHKTEYTLVEKT